jgi:23S rRNA pseudouridine2605 synthase
MSERLHKLLAQHGLGSRREIERWIEEGRVLVNSRPARAGERYSHGDRVVIDGKDVSARLRVSAAPQILIYHKSQGQPVSARANETGDGMKSVTESLPKVRGSRWLAINTMQTDDSGLLVLTSDGRLADALRRRAETIPAAYVARVLVPHPEFDPDSISRVVQYDDDTIEFESIEPAGGEGTNRWFLVKSHRAHRRAAVRALFESRGLKVSRVVQVKFGDLELPRDLPRGRHRALSEKQVVALYGAAGLAMPNESRGQRNKRQSRPTRSAPNEQRASRKSDAARKPTGTRRSRH